MTWFSGGLLISLFGLVAGSFFNVCIHRLPHGSSIVVPSSRCPKCGQRIRWSDNVPILGYVRLRGRCRHCRTAISPTYLIVEIVTPVLFLIQYQDVGFELLLVPRLFFIGAMIVLLVIDLRHLVVPDVITIPGICIGLLSSCFVRPGLFESLLGLVAGGTILLLISEVYYRIRNEVGLGMGDVKMLAMIGAFLGWKLMLVALVLASSIGSIVGVGMIIAARADSKSALPLGAFLAAASIGVTVVGEPLIVWYMSFY